jgi:hypothetical protein
MSTSHYTEYETELETDLPNIIHCLTAPPARDDSEAEWERINNLSSALQGWQHKYGDDLIEEVESLLADMARHLVENCGYGEFSYGN